MNIVILIAVSVAVGYVLGKFGPQKIVAFVKAKLGKGTSDPE